MSWFKRERRSKGDPQAKVSGTEAFREYLDEYKRELLTLIAEREFSKRATEPLAPWLCYHFPLQFDRRELDARGVDFLVYAEKDSFFWHTLDGAACMKAFLAHFRALPLDGRIAYFKRFDLGPRWVDREAWFDLAFDDERVGDPDYDLAHAEIFEPRSTRGEAPRS
jgi:hypothetical protein